MKLRTIDDFDFKGKRVLLRLDINSPVKNGKVLMNDRIVESAKTIRGLNRKGASSIVALAHQSRPGKDDFISLKGHARLLSRYVKTEFVDCVVGRRALDRIDSLKKGEVLLLDNVRKEKSEFEPSVKNKMVVKLKERCDIYVNDAFSVAHRNQTSIVSFPKVMPSCVGRAMERELEHLSKIKIKDCLFVLGGAKMKEVVGLIDGKRRVLAGGMLGPLVLRANGLKFGETDKYLDKKYFRKLRNPKKVVVPIDFAVSVKGKRKELMLDEFPSKHRVLDIGEMSIEIFKEEIKKAKCIFVKGPQGNYEVKGFDVGTREIIREVSRSKGFKIIGGGHSSNALKEMGISKKKFDYVSLSGGALVKYISGEKLVGLEALKRGKR
ncbi:MAG: phosphoglycerate kinase [archaeon]